MNGGHVRYYFIRVDDKYVECFLSSYVPSCVFRDESEKTDDLSRFAWVEFRGKKSPHERKLIEKLKKKYGINSVFIEYATIEESTIIEKSN